MRFKEWFRLQEVGSGTNCVATFSLPLGAGFGRDWPPPIADSIWKSPEESKKEKHQKKKRK